MALQVVFGAGPLGLAVSTALLARGHTVRLVNRSGQAAIARHPLLEMRAADAFDPTVVRRICVGAEAVFQCAATAYSAAAWRNELSLLQRNIMFGAAEASARLVVGDNLYLYGSTTEPMREDSPIRPCSEKGRIRARMAEEILTAHANRQLSAAIVRGSDFFGPHVVNSIFGVRTILPAMQGKRASLTGNIDLPHTLTYIGDFGKAMAMVGASDAAMGQAWHVPSAPTVTQRELAAMLFAEIGRPMKVRAMGKMTLRMGALFVPAAREMIEMMYQFEAPFVLDHAKFAGRFGNIATPHANAIAETVAWYADKFKLPVPHRSRHADVAA